MYAKVEDSEPFSFTMRKEFPEEGELVLATVQEIFKQGAFITLDEYENKRGLLHISEISLKWVKNIRDYLKEGQKVVLKVLGVDPKKGHIDLSLRRVTEAERKTKLREVKERQRARKLLYLLAERLRFEDERASQLVRDVEEELIRHWGTAYEALEAIVADERAAEVLRLPKGWKQKLLELAKKHVKLPTVEVKGYLELKSYASNGVEVVKNTLLELKRKKFEGAELELTYISAPYYQLKVKAPDYKTAERVLEDASKFCISRVQEMGGEGAFHRKFPR